MKLVNLFYRGGLLTVGLIFFLTCGQPVLATSDPIVAEIGGEKITLSRFQQEVKQLPPNLRQMVSDQKIRQDFLEQLATSILLYQEGLRQGIDKQPEVRQQIEETTRKIVLGSLLQKAIESNIKAPDEAAVEQYYLTHADEFSSEKQVHASHILVKEQAEAEAISAELGKGADFAQLARDKSTCSSAARGGDLGFFTRDRMVKEFADVAFSLKPGEISPPVKTKFGYHLIKLDEVKEAGTRPLAEVKTTIENKLIQEQKSRLFEDYVAGLKKKNPYKVYPENLAN